jgi:beta-amyrin synthase
MLCYCRLIYMPMSYLYGKRFVGPITPLILKLREELLTQPYERVDWKKVRHQCAKVRGILFLINHNVHTHIFFIIYMSDNCPFNILLQEDLYYPHPLIQDLIWDSLYIVMEPIMTHWPFNKLVRDKALQKVMKHIHYEDENSRYITIGCVNKVVIS